MYTNINKKLSPCLKINVLRHNCLWNAHFCVRRLYPTKGSVYPCWCRKVVLKVGTTYWSSHKILHFTNFKPRYHRALLYEMVTRALWRGWNKERRDGEGHYCTAVHHQSVSNGGHTKVKKRIWHTRTLKFDNLSHHVCSRHIKVLIFLWFLCTYILCKVAQNNLLYLSLTMVTQEGNHGDHANQGLLEMDWIDSIF